MAEVRGAWGGRRVLVTGASGFVGSHLVRRLLSVGADVQIWRGPSRSAAHLADLGARSASVPVDLRDAAQVTAAARAGQPEVVFHLAAYGVQVDQPEFQAAVEVNILGTAHLFAGLRGTACRRVVATGTWAEYAPSSAPLRETDALGPLTAYGMSKAAATLLALRTGQTTGMPVVVLRPFSVYGPGEDARKFVPAVITAALRGTSPQLTSGRQIRDYVYVEDVVDAYLAAATADITEPEVFNIASGRAAPLREVAGEILRHFPGIEAAFGTRPERPHEVAHVAADISQAARRLGWTPRWTLAEGLRMTVASFRAAAAGPRPARGGRPALLGAGGPPS
jgi:nucleoside-diphosphate-sugar epimerase